MIKKWILSMLILSLFLSLPWAYCQQLTERERRIYYDMAWQMLELEYRLSLEPLEETGGEGQEILQEFLKQNGISEDELDDIIARGNQMLFTVAEEQLARDLKTEISDYLAPEETMARIKDLANKYGMSVGQVSTVFTRSMLRDEEE